mgnify:CR=1 FL=1
MDIWLLLYALVFLCAFPKTKWHRKPRLCFKLVIGDPSQTRYLRYDSVLGTTQTTTGTYIYPGGTNPGQVTVYYRFRVYRRTPGGDILITDWVTHSTRSGNGSGLVSYNWNCPQTSMNPEDAVRFDIRVDYGGALIGTKTFVTEALGATTLSGVTWTIWLYTWYNYSTVGDKTEGRIYYGNSTYNSRIENFTYIVPPTAPSDCSASIVTETTLTVSWKDQSTDEDDFHVERKVSGGSYSEVQIVVSTTKAGTGTVYTWDNSGLLIQTTYYYRVRAHRHSDNIYLLYTSDATDE